MQGQIKTQISLKKLAEIDEICRKRQISRWKFTQEALTEKIALEKEMYRHDRTPRATPISRNH